MNLMIGVIIGVFVGGVLGVAVMCLLRMAKPTGIDSGIEPSLGQEDRFVVLENAEEIEENMEKSKGWSDYENQKSV